MDDDNVYSQLVRAYFRAAGLPLSDYDAWSGAKKVAFARFLADSASYLRQYNQREGQTLVMPGMDAGPAAK